MSVKKLTCLMLGALLFSLAGPAWASSPGQTAKPSPDQVIEILTQGNQRFASHKATRTHADAARLSLAASQDQGKYALATVITCSDSRVPVEIIFDAGIMDLFVIRVAGNVCQTDEIGSIEYGLAHVHTPVLVVLGHTQCGAVNAVTKAVQGQKVALERNIPPLVAPIQPAVQKALAVKPGLKGQALIDRAIEENVWQGIHDLFMASPATRKLVSSGKVKVVGGIYDLASGQVKWLPQAKSQEILAQVEADPKKATKPMAD